MGRLFAFVACRDFYITCERNYNPSLEGKPLLLLDENDCIQSLSAEAKELGLQRGVPMFLYATTIREHQAFVYHVNNLLCQDMTARLQGMLSTFASNIECWAPDQLFLDLIYPENESWERLDSIAEQLKATIRLGTGMSSHVGIAQTRTLAHLATRLGIDNLTDPYLQEYVLSQVSVGSVWGISPTYRDLLNSVGIVTALDLRDAEDGLLRQIMGVTGIRLALELRNISCLEEEDFPASIPEILCWRKFPEVLTIFSHLQETTAITVSSMAHQLQMQGLSARLMALSLYPCPGADYFHTTLLKFSIPLHQATELVKQAEQGINQVFSASDTYAQLRIVLSGLSPTVPLAKVAPKSSQSTMQMMEGVNDRMGSSAVQIASAGMQQLQHSRVTRRLSLPFYGATKVAGA